MILTPLIRSSRDEGMKGWLVPPLSVWARHGYFSLPLQGQSEEKKSLSISTIQAPHTHTQVLVKGALSMSHTHSKILPLHSFSISFIFLTGSPNLISNQVFTFSGGNVSDRSHSALHGCCYDPLRVTMLIKM